MAPAIPFIAVAMAAIGAGVTVHGQIQQGKSQSAMASYNAKLARRNAGIARENAEYEARQKRRETARLIGRQRILYGKAGVIMEGSPLAVIEETAAQGEKDALMIERGYAQQGSSYLSQAKLTRMRAANYKRQGYSQAGSTLLTGAGKAIGGYKGTG